ncbi:hypothetical protein Hanom_Chr01g00052481 [Helianthus anomalus]
MNLPGRSHRIMIPGVLLIAFSRGFELLLTFVISTTGQLWCSSSSTTKSSCSCLIFVIGFPVSRASK